ncbi:hypothetical protein EVAR_53490_1 [Eumeta japonica]|uniref:Uncharacterized protein n=1 Tax=Eumeta variegata TaxID=151549 RepID=A0A4C1YQE2_EUMVA|nr:hypothetical protein EVAR_53490_1 [Eumeta japonica]
MQLALRYFKLNPSKLKNKPLSAASRNKYDIGTLNEKNRREPKPIVGFSLTNHRFEDVWWTPVRGCRQLMTVLYHKFYVLWINPSDHLGTAGHEKTPTDASPKLWNDIGGARS